MVVIVTRSVIKYQSDSFELLVKVINFGHFSKWNFITEGYTYKINIFNKVIQNNIKYY